MAQVNLFFFLDKRKHISLSESTVVDQKTPPLKQSEQVLCIRYIRHKQAANAHCLWFKCQCRVVISNSIHLCSRSAFKSTTTPSCYSLHLLWLWCHHDIITIQKTNENFRILAFKERLSVFMDLILDFCNWEPEIDTRWLDFVEYTLTSVTLSVKQNQNIFCVLIKNTNLIFFQIWVQHVLHLVFFKQIIKHLLF